MIDGLAIMIGAYIAMRCVEVWAMAPQRYVPNMKGLVVIASIFTLAAVVFGAVIVFAATARMANPLG